MVRVSRPISFLQTVDDDETEKPHFFAKYKFFGKSIGLSSLEHYTVYPQKPLKHLSSSEMVNFLPNHTANQKLGAEANDIKVSFWPMYFWMVKLARALETS